MKFSPWAWCFVAYLCSSCVRGAFRPVNAGREYGDPVPIMVSHIGQGSPHYILQNVLCFDYLCRTKAGKKKAMRAISFEDFKKRVRKNAKKGEYKGLIQVPKKVKQDSIPAKKKPVPIVIAPEPIPEVAAPILKSDSLIILGDREVLFEINSAVLKGKHIVVLDSLGKFLQAHPTLEVEVTGHTDNTGAESHNVVLSTRRAEGVADYLVNHGAIFDQVSFEGFGSSRPITGNETPQGRSRNRRVEIRLHDPASKR